MKKHIHILAIISCLSALLPIYWFYLSIPSGFKVFISIFLFVWAWMFWMICEGKSEWMNKLMKKIDKGIIITTIAGYQAFFILALWYFSPVGRGIKTLFSALRTFPTT